MTYAEFDDIRRNLRLTIAEVAIILGVTRQTINNWSKKGFPEWMEDKLAGLRRLHDSASGDFETYRFPELLALAVVGEENDPGLNSFTLQSNWRAGFGEYCRQASRKSPPENEMKDLVPIIVATSRSSVDRWGSAIIALKLFLESRGIGTWIHDASDLVSRMIDNDPLPEPAIIIGTPEENPIARILWMVPPTNEWTAATTWENTDRYSLPEITLEDDGFERIRCTDQAVQVIGKDDRLRNAIQSFNVNMARRVDANKCLRDYDEFVEPKDRQTEEHDISSKGTKD